MPPTPLPAPAAAPIGLAPFHVMEMTARARALELEGRSVLRLQSGEPGAPPAPAVIEAVARALPQPQHYTHSLGRIELRQALVRHYAEHHGVAVDPESIIVTMGSSAGFILAFLSAFEPGARIAVTRPGYPAYLNTLTGLGFRPVEIAVSAEAGWRLSAEDIEAAYAKSPFDGLLFASPANPTGASVDREALNAIVATCARLGIRFISDEIYHRLDYRGPSVSALEFSAEPLIVNSFSKYYCMTGWRIGWLVLPPDVLRKAEMLQQNLFIAAPTLSQIGAEAAFAETAYYEAEKAKYVANGRALREGLARLGFAAVRQGDGAFYSYVDVTRFSNDSMQFCRDLLEREGVCITPGIDFDRIDGHKFVRLSYAGTRAQVEEAVERLGRFVGA